MSKYITIYVIVLAALGLIAIDLLTSDSAEPAVAFAFVENEQETNEKVTAHQRFRTVLQPTIRALADGKIALRDASADVYTAAQANSPIYLQMTAITEPGKSVEERIAHNLIGHLEDLIESEIVAPARLAALQAELSEMARDSDQR
jgi:hypothetical protein